MKSWMSADFRRVPDALHPEAVTPVHASELRSTSASAFVDGVQTSDVPGAIDRDDADGICPYTYTAASMLLRSTIAPDPADSPRPASGGGSTSVPSAPTVTFAAGAAHAPDDATRSRLMPVNRAVGVERLMQSCRGYFEKTGRRISYEYAMVDGMNDSDEQADLLASLLKGQPAHVNLIPLNNVEESPLKPSRRVKQFQKRLEQHGVTCTVRRKLGSDIDASCGQLRRKAMNHSAR